VHARRFRVLTNAKTAIQAGGHVMLEKPPGATLSEATLGKSWRVEAAFRSMRQAIHAKPRWSPPPNPGCGQAAPKSLVVTLEGRCAHGIRATWIWQAGGLGVLKSRINALSIVTEILAPIRSMLPRPNWLTRRIRHDCSEHGPFGASTWVRSQRPNWISAKKEDQILEHCQSKTESGNPVFV